MLKRLPLALVCLRALLAPLMPLLAAYRPEPAVFAACLSTAILSDFFDGVITRRLGVATAGLRRLDSIADTIFYLGALAAVWMLYPDVIRGNAVPLAILLVLEVGRYILDFLKFGREASYHMWSSKLWGLVLFLAFFMVLVVGEAMPWVGMAVIVDILSDTEGLFISVLLPVWRHDVPSVVHAWRIRALLPSAGRR